ncbi:hypothetical protein [Legionella brunensis]|uniref:Effector protein B, substrate of the Dot/Icm secretion system n=1 Tax=Legionella brunensis TaxID=29422 RepID=A0A0W0S1Y2_9GAMM|nr:hypothetical protein [Legionella brunensis]KTC77117.1 hypothetical protein Lbru_3224 [Legionella brunensis]
MLVYNGKELIKFKDKTGGKNRNEIDGFYRDSEGNEFFIKKPGDPKELFTELFAGLLLDEFKQCGLIPEPYHRSFICANFIQIEDGSYALIQPKASFKELHKIIGTGNRQGTDRDPVKEMFLGPSYYLLLTTALENYFALSLVLMVSLMIGDYSVHSGNVVCLDSDHPITQFARIDLGAAFRYFGYKENNLDILNPYEYHGWFNPTSFTKGYVLNYKHITGLFPAIAKKAQQFKEQVDHKLLEDIVTTVLQKIPSDLIKDNVKEEVAQYIGIESFKEVKLGIKVNQQQFPLDLIEILQLRLKKISELQDISPEKSKPTLYRSLSSDDLIAQDKLILPANEGLPFPEQLSVWQETLTTGKDILTVNRVNLPQLVAEFNSFIDIVIKQAELISQRPYSSPPHTCPMTKATECAEAMALRQLFTLNNDGTPAFNDKSILGHKRSTNSPWQDVEKILFAGFNVIVTIRVARQTQLSFNPTGAKDDALKTLFSALQVSLASFRKNYQLLLEKLVLTLARNTQETTPNVSFLPDKPIPTQSEIEDAPCLNTKLGLHLLKITKQLQKKMQQDYLLTQAIANSKIEPFPINLIKDLLILKEFHDSQIALNQENQLGEDYNSSIHQFYKEALSTRLSGDSLPLQINALLKSAYQKFQAQQKTRILSESLVMIGSLFDGLGLIVGLGHKVLDKTFLFNSASTSTEGSSNVRLIKNDTSATCEPNSSLLDPT